MITFRLDDLNNQRLLSDFLSGLCCCLVLFAVHSTFFSFSFVEGDALYAKQRHCSLLEKTQSLILARTYPDPSSTQNAPVSGDRRHDEISKISIHLLVLYVFQFFAVHFLFPEINWPVTGTVIQIVEMLESALHESTLSSPVCSRQSQLQFFFFSVLTFCSFRISLLGHH